MKIISAIIIFISPLFLNSAVYSIDLKEMKEIGCEAFTITYSNGDYQYLVGKKRKNAVGYGCLIKEGITVWGVYYNQKDTSKVFSFLVMPNQDWLLFSALKNMATQE